MAKEKKQPPADPLSSLPTGPAATDDFIGPVPEPRGSDAAPAPVEPVVPAVAPPPAEAKLLESFPPVTAADVKALLPPPVPAPAKSGTIRARVNVHQTHVGAIEVEIPADTPPEKRRAAAIEAAKEARGIVHFGVDPEVEFL